MGRRKKQLPANGLEIIRELAEKGVQKTKIAKALDMSFNTFQRILDENEQAQQTLEEARQIEHDKLFSVVFEKAMNGDTTCALFLLKTRFGYQEGKELVNANQVNVSISIPGSMDPDDYKKEIEVENE